MAGKSTGSFIVEVRGQPSTTPSMHPTAVDNTIIPPFCVLPQHRNTKMVPRPCRAIVILTFMLAACADARIFRTTKPFAFSERTISRHHDAKLADVFIVPRGGSSEATASTTSSSSVGVVSTLISGLFNYMSGAKSDTITLLTTTALVAPICKKLGLSSILGFLASGMALGPNGIKGGLISDVRKFYVLSLTVYHFHHD